MSAKGYKFYTYLHIRNDIGEVFYVGKGSGRRAFALGRNPHWNAIVAKHGHTVHIVAYFANEVDAFEHEKEMIAELREAGFNLANMTDGGEGVRATAEVRAKISIASRKTMENPAAREHLSKINMGHTVSAATREKISKAALGRAQSAETRAKIRAASTGRTHSAETRAKISANKRGSVYSDESRARMSESGKRRPPISDETRAKMQAATKGRIVSKETRAKMSLIMRGRTASEETRAKMKGRKFTAEHREKLSIAQKARAPNSEETRRKKSISQKNRREMERQRSAA